MSSICVDSALKQDHWYRIAAEMLGQARIAINGTKPQDIRVKNPKFFQRVLQEGSLGLGESYMDGWWECDRLDIFFQCILASELDNQLPKRLSDVARIASARIFNYQTRKRAWIVGKEHYDLGNDLFSRMLDSYMQYSCAYWKEAETLEQAQQAKLRMICEKLQLKPGMTLLDIGCGWGGLSAFAAKEYGVSVKGVTISVEQQVMAQERCKGLDVQIQLQDYRDLNERFDRIVSVGMFEHVGPKNYRTTTSAFIVCLLIILMPVPALFVPEISSFGRYCSALKVFMVVFESIVNGSYPDKNNCRLNHGGSC
ncbi:cyclopropane-fatty-acyl-phospholipid synthase [Yersinia frederiksenii]|nr:cyclopropane-fatty-acyl-phospholipid synthase [Yersinia frederiksenii]CNI28758.1 cyclopropane-fatty-acyl-phospholipid synthase [Yersinia frederiksenii]